MQHYLFVQIHYDVIFVTWFPLFRLHFLFQTTPFLRLTSRFAVFGSRLVFFPFFQVSGFSMFVNIDVCRRFQNCTFSQIQAFRPRTRGFSLGFICTSGVPVIGSPYPIYFFGASASTTSRRVRTWELFPFPTLF